MISSAAKLGHVSEDGIRQLVDAFYDKVRLDAELAPIFLRAIPGDWEPHLTRMYAFWSSVMLTTGRYKGNETCGELFDDGVSEEFRAKAARIAESLKLALFYRPDRPWPPEATP